MRSIKRYLITMILLGGFALSGVGCSPDSFLAGFSLGWLMGTQNLPATTEYTCYHNGQPIDCSAIPSEMMPRS